MNMGVGGVGVGVGWVVPSSTHLWVWCFFLRPCESTEDATEAREARSESRSPEDVVSLLLVEALSVQHVLGRGGGRSKGQGITREAATQRLRTARDSLSTRRTAVTLP
jgi:hypothetical protein